MSSGRLSISLLFTLLNSCICADVSHGTFVKKIPGLDPGLIMDLKVIEFIYYQ